LARTVYQSALPFLHARSWLPKDDNSYTYTEIAAGACAGHVLTGADEAELHRLETTWLAGTVQTQALADSVAALERAVSDHADMRALFGTVRELLGDGDGARQQYWDAHRACPYYDRAHEGLRQIRAGERLRS